MKALITQAQGFVREVEVEPLAAQPGSYLVQFSSQLASARNPQEWQRNFALIVQRHELEALRDLFVASL